MAKWLVAEGYPVNRKRISRLTEVMGIEAVYPKPRLSQPGEGHKICPYLLRGVTVDRVNRCGARTSSISGWRRSSCTWMPPERRLERRNGRGGFDAETVPKSNSDADGHELIAVENWS